MRESLVTEDRTPLLTKRNDRWQSSRRTRERNQKRAAVKEHLGQLYTQVESLERWLRNNPQAEE